MAKRTSIESELAWGFAFCLGVVTVADALFRQKAAREAKLRADLNQAYLKSIHAKLSTKQ